MQTKIKRIRSTIVLLMLLLIVPVANANMFDDMANFIKTVGVSHTNTAKDDVPLAPVSEIVNEINANQEFIDVIRQTGINSITIQTDVRQIHLKLKNRVYETDKRGPYTVQTTEAELNQLYNKYKSGEEISVLDLESAFKVPLMLRLKIWSNLT